MRTTHTENPVINEATVVHIFDAGFPFCYTRSRGGGVPGPLWKFGPMVRKHSSANCPDCLKYVCR